MKLRLTDLRGKHLDINVELLAASYGLKGFADARLYENDEEFLARLDDDRELGGEG